MIINNVDLPFNVFNADTAERYELAVSKLQAYSPNKNLKLSEIIRGECTAIYEFFDTIFGASTADTLFEGKYDLSLCTECAEKVIMEVHSQAQEIKNRQSKYSIDRVSR